MCYTGRCPHERLVGEFPGECTRKYNERCPEEFYRCHQCGALIEEEEFIETNGYCYACLPEEC